MTRCTRRGGKTLPVGSTAKAFAESFTATRPDIESDSLSAAKRFIYVPISSLHQVASRYRLG